MTFLLDTNVVSEWVKPHPDPHVAAWLSGVDEDRVFLSVITVAEIRYGIALMPEGRRRERLRVWLTDAVPERFEGRILDVDRPMAEAWGVLMVRTRQAGVTMGSMDAFVAATAQARGLTLVTRNVRDFSGAGIALLNPWTPPE